MNNSLYMNKYSIGQQNIITDEYQVCPIQEAHPLKQGLKRNDIRITDMNLLIQEAHPLKQGLKRYQII